LGSPCVPPAPGERDPCGSKLYLVSCQSTTATCALDPRLGEPCDPTYDTCREAYCDTAARVCAEHKRYHDACVDARECASARCVDGVCN
jgi:hypothetical protein